MKVYQYYFQGKFADDNDFIDGYFYSSKTIDSVCVDLERKFKKLGIIYHHVVLIGTAPWYKINRLELN